MSTIMIALTGIALSALAVLALCAGDPKRRRAIGQAGCFSSRLRSVLVAATCFPSLAFAAMGYGAALAMWLGAIGLVGWFAAACFSKQA